MPALAAALATLHRFRARACVVLACVAAMLCVASNASALERMQTKTRVWDFSFATALNIRLNAAASPRTRLENQSSSAELASGSLLAARAAPQVAKAIDPNKLHHIFGKAGHNLGPLVEKFGSQEATFRAVESATQAAVKSRGLTGVFETTVSVGGQNVVVRGNVMEGAARVGTFFIP